MCHPSFVMQLFVSSFLRSEAFYEADQKHSDNAQVIATRNSGIRARIFDNRTPQDILTQPVQQLVEVSCCCSHVLAGSV